MDLRVLADLLASSGAGDLRGSAAAALREAAAAASGDSGSVGDRIRWLRAALLITEDFERVMTLRMLVDTLQQAADWDALLELAESEDVASRPAFLDDVLRALHWQGRHADVLATIDRSPSESFDDAVRRIKPLFMLERFDDARVHLDIATGAARSPLESALCHAGEVIYLAFVGDAADVRETADSVTPQTTLDRLRAAAADADLVGLERLLVGMAAEPAVGARPGLLASVRASVSGGRWDDALDTARSGIQPDSGVPAPSQTEQLMLRAISAQVHTRRGDPSRAADLLAGLSGEGPAGRRVSLARAEHRRARGDRPGARRELARAAARAERLGYASGVAELHALAVEFAVEAADPSSAGDHLARLERAAERSGSTDDRAFLLRGRAIVGRDAAGALTAADLRTRTSFDRARDLLLAVELDPRDAEPASEAHRLFSALGADPWALRLRAVLRRSAQPVPRIRTTSDDVSRRRDLVIQRVCIGETNEQIARGLLVSVKTIERDLTRIYAQTGTRSRTALAARFGTQPDAGTSGGARVPSIG